jgi:hypothetical protein
MSGLSSFSTCGIVHDLAVSVPETDTEDFFARFPVGVLNHGVVELAATDEVEYFTLIQGLIRRGGHGWAHEGDANVRIGLADCFGKALIAGPPGCACEEHEEVIVPCNLDRLGGGNVMRRCVEQARTLEHAGRIRKPDRVPVRLNFTGGGPTGTGTSIEVLKRRRVQKQCF